MNFRTTKTFADFIAAANAAELPPELLSQVKSDMVDGQLVLGTTSTNANLLLFLQRFAGRERAPGILTDLSADDLLALATKFEELAQQEGRDLQEVAEKEIAPIKAELVAVQETLTKLNVEIEAKDKLISELKAAPAVLPADATALEAAREAREHQRKRELLLLEQEHEMKLEVIRGESALKLATEKAQADAKASEAKAAADAALAREKAKNDETIAKLQAETARAVAAETARDEAVGKHAVATARINRKGAIVAAVGVLAGVIVKAVFIDDKTPPAADASSRTAPEKAPVAKTSLSPTCDGFPGTWKRPGDSEVFQIAATTDCQLIVTAITPKFEQFMVGRVRDGTHLQGSLLRYQVSNGCVLHLETHLDKIAPNEIKQEVTKTIGNCPPVGPDYTERFILTRVQ